jgi:hypothetical protein
MKNPLKDFRKSLYINPGFQRQFIVFTSLISLGYTGSLLLANSLFFNYFTKKGMELGLNEEHIYYDLLEAQRSYMNMVSFSMAIFVVSLTWYLALKLSHRVAGPVYKINKILTEWLEGKNPGEIKLRSDDFFKDLAETCNKAMNKSENKKS